MEELETTEKPDSNSVPKKKKHKLLPKQNTAKVLGIIESARGLVDVGALGTTTVLNQEGERNILLGVSVVELIIGVVSIFVVLSDLYESWSSYSSKNRLYNIRYHNAYEETFENRNMISETGHDHALFQSIIYALKNKIFWKTSSQKKHENSSDYKKYKFFSDRAAKSQKVMVQEEIEYINGRNVARKIKLDVIYILPIVSGIVGAILILLSLGEKEIDDETLSLVGIWLIAISVAFAKSINSKLEKEMKIPEVSLAPEELDILNDAKRANQNKTNVSTSSEGPEKPNDIEKGNGNTVKALEEQAKQFGFLAIDVKPDGNCFYNALSKHTKETPEKLREIAIERLKSRSSYYQQSIEGSFEHYINDHTKNGIWVEEPIIAALARSLNITIVIIQSNGNEPKIYKPHESKMTAYLGYINNLHYRSLHIDKSIEATKNIEDYINKAEFMRDDEVGLSNEENEVMTSEEDESQGASPS